jgi:hypothetical protein
MPVTYKTKCNNKLIAELMKADNEFARELTYQILKGGFFDKPKKITVKGITLIVKELG